MKALDKLQRFMSPKPMPTVGPAWVHTLMKALFLVCLGVLIFIPIIRAWMSAETPVAAAGAAELTTPEVRPAPPEELDGQALADHLVAHGCVRCLVQGKNLSGTTVDGADLTQAVFQDVNLVGASLRGAKLDGGHIEASKLDGASFVGASMTSFTTGCSPFFFTTQCTDPMEEGATLDLSGADLTGADLSGLHDVLLTGATVEGATLYVAFPPSLALAPFENIRLSPAYNSNAEPLSFHRDEVTLLAPHVQRTEHSWVPYRYDLEPTTDAAARAAFEAAGDPPSPVAAGRYYRVGRAPQLPPELATSTVGEKLLRLLRNDSDYLEIAASEDGSLLVTGEGLGGNGHTCTIHGASFRLDPATGRHRYAAGAAEPAEERLTGSLAFAGRYAQFEGGSNHCGARATLIGFYELVDAK